MKIFFLIFFLSLNLQAVELKDLKFGGFLDTSYAYDFNNPANHEREYTTQPVRHNEFNVNLAYFDITLNKEDLRGRLALQMGQSVTKNTVFEPREGATSGPQDAKIFQEAYIGKKIGERTWIDAGIFLGNIGAESWISKDNWTYTRALNLDYVPYYSSGLRLEHKLSQKETVQLQVLNGWQNMSENNNSKAIGMQYKNEISPRSTFTYNNFLGDEQVVSPRSRFRVYHNFIFKFLYSEKWQYLMALDLAHQSQQKKNGVDAWGAATLTVRRVLSQIRALALRMEYYNDRHQTNIVTSTPNGFQVMGASMNYDQKLDETSLWRTELRGFYSKDGIYPATSQSKNRWDGVLVSSLSFWF
jgi:Putative beta-barrel porin-2, OmpL-like. bbp2